MKKLALLLLSIVFTVPCFATTYTSVAGTVNWNDSNSWSPVGVPGSGDTAILSDDSTVVCPAGVTCVIGTSPSGDTGAVALQCASAAGTGAFLNYGTFVWQGPVRQCNANWVMEAGSTLTYDSSHAAAPATALYTWAISQANNQSDAVLILAGTPGARVTVNIAPGSGNSGGFGSTTSTTYYNGGNFQCTDADIQHQGAPNSSGYLLRFRPTNDGSSVTFSGCNIDSSGQIWGVVPIGAASVVSINQTSITNPINSSQTIQLDASTAMTTGVRNLTNSVIQGITYINNTDGGASGFCFKNDVMERLTSSSATILNFRQGGTVACWDQMVLYGFYETAIVPSGTLTNSLVYRTVDPGSTNIHPIYVCPETTDILLTSWIFDSPVSNDNGDMVEAKPCAPAPGLTMGVTHSIYMPSGFNNAVGSFINDSGGAVRYATNFKVYFDHNTVFVSNQKPGQVYGVGCEGGTTWNAGIVSSIRNNIAWRYGTGSGILAQSTTACNVDPAAVSVADYNASYTVSSDLYGTPTQQYAVTPGAHDVNADPQFVDTTRNLLAWDTAGLGNAFAPAWTSGKAYSVGQEVSSSDPTFYNGATYNYICIAAHTASSKTKPGTGSVSEETWAPASLFDLHRSITAGETFNGGTQSMIGQLIGWIQAGYAPQNSAMHNASSDGTDIGAVAYGSGSL